jgi:hypothetical protein
MSKGRKREKRRVDMQRSKHYNNENRETETE